MRSQNIILLILVTFEINNLATSIKARGWDKVPPMVKLEQGSPPAGLWKGMFNWLGKVRLGKVLISYNYKCYQRA